MVDTSNQFYVCLLFYQLGTWGCYIVGAVHLMVLNMIIYILNDIKVMYNIIYIHTYNPPKK